MSFDETYDEMLRAEFSSRGRHAAPDAEPVLHEDAGPVLEEESIPHGLHMAAADALINDEDAPIHDEFDPAASPEVVEQQTSAGGEGPRGLARYRNAAMVGAGGLACAAVGAFLGGIGGYFTVNPAAARVLSSASAPDQSLATAVNQAHDAAFSPRGTEATGTASFASLSGSLTQGLGPLQWLIGGGGSNPGMPTDATLADLSEGATSGSGSSTGTGAGSGLGTGIGSDCTGTGNDLGLGCVLDSLTTALGNVGTLPSDPTGQVDGLAPTLSGVVTNMTGTLGDLTSLLSISSLPLPSGGIPSAGLPGLGTLGGALPGSGSAGTSPLSGAGGVGSLLSGVTAAVAGVTGGSTSPSVPSLPSSGGSGSASPATAPGSTPATTTTTTTNPSGGGTTTTVTVPLPALPVPSTPPVSVGGISVGIGSGGSSGSGSGLTLTLP